MPLVLGIDEAGYGPTLGPLVVGATLWQITPRRGVAAGTEDDLWKRLSKYISRPPGHGAARLVVGDSKAVFDRKKGIATLERPVLAFAAAAGLPCTDLRSLLGALGADLVTTTSVPWYRELDLPLPCAGSASAFIGAAERLQRGMSAAAVRCTGLCAIVVPEDAYNQRVRTTRNKATLLAEQVLRLIAHAYEQTTSADLVVHVDHLGGRQNYRHLLLTAFPDHHLHELEASPAWSRYRLAGAGRDLWVDFRVSAEQHHVPVALASMLAKYLREALMHRFNAFWQSHLPTLRPTAGYHGDAQRFLVDIADTIAATGLPRDHFVRFL